MISRGLSLLFLYPIEEFNLPKTMLWSTSLVICAFTAALGGGSSVSADSVSFWKRQDGGGAYQWNIYPRSGDSPCWCNNTQKGDWPSSDLAIPQMLPLLQVPLRLRQRRLALNPKFRLHRQSCMQLRLLIPSHLAMTMYPPVTSRMTVQLGHSACLKMNSPSTLEKHTTV